MVEHQPAVPPLGNTPGTTPSPDPASLAGARALREAVRLAALGYVLVPVTIRRREDGKKDAVFHIGWRAGGTSRPDVLRDWSVQYAGCSFAILCGPSGIEVVDLDAAEGGPGWWSGQGMPVPEVVVDTPGGGQHLYWRRRPGAEPDDRLVNNAGQVAPGVDARTVGGLVFAPGSFVLGEEDRPYVARTALPEPDRLAETPRVVLGLWSRARTAQPRPYTPGVVDQARAFTLDEARAYVAQEAQAPLLEAQYGQNVNDRINRAALVLGHFTPTFWTADEARAAVREWVLAGPGRRNGWRELDREDVASIESGLRRGMAEPYALRVAPGSNHLADGVPEPVDLPASTKTAGPGATSDDTADLGRYAGMAIPEPGSAYEVLAAGAVAAAGGALADLPAPMSPLEVALERGRIARQVRRMLDAEERGPVAPPSSTSLAALLAEPDEGPAYVVDQLWPAGGKVLLAAPQKAGKTTLVGNLVRALADGVGFLAKPQVTLVSPGGGDTGWQVAAAGFAVPAPRRVFVLDFEMTRQKLRQWLREQRIRNLDTVHVELMRGRSWDIRDPEIREPWAGHLHALGVNVLIVDPVGPILHGLGVDENDNTAVGGFLAALDALVRDAGVSELFVVHHAGHGTERARGASSFLGWPDANWRLVRSDATDARAFAADGRDVFVPETVLEYDRLERRLWLGQGDRSQAAGNADADLVAQVVTDECEQRGQGQAGPGVRELERLLSEGQGWNKTRADKALKAALNLGLVHPHPGSMYPGHQRTAKLHHPGSLCDDCSVSPVSPGVPPVS